MVNQQADNLNEYKIGKHIPSLHIHSPIFFSEPRKKPFNGLIASLMAMEPASKEALVFMRYIPGTSIKEALAANNQTQFKLELALAAFEALKRVHEAGVVHRDIKPGNVKVKTGGIAPWMEIFDFGGSRMKDELSRGCVYTLFYEPPELHLNTMQTQASDIFSMACLVARDIFGADENPAKSKAEKFKSIEPTNPISKAHQIISAHSLSKKIKASSVKCKFKHILTDSDFLDKCSKYYNPRHREEINNLLNRMVAKDPEARPRVDEAIFVFSRILWERMLVDVTRSKHEIMLQAKQIALHTRKQLEQGNQTHQANPKLYLQQVVEQITADFKMISNDPQAVAIYIHYLRIDLFAGLKSGRECVDQLAGNIEQYLALRDSCRELLAQVKMLGGEKLVYKVRFHPKAIPFLHDKLIHLCKKIDGFKSMDELALLNEKMQRYLHKVNPVIQQLSDMISEEKERLLAKEKQVKKPANTSIWGTVTEFVGGFFQKPKSPEPAIQHILIKP